ncbi:MAG: hypothetical protein GY880_03335 [Planctomycetaceae bacterium]|jgi:hypothetical protein|nr:hypothetical protein [Planctomycetaceae bacterium]
MTNFQKFIASVDSTANITISGTACKCGWVHTTTANNVSIDGDRVMFYDHKIKRWVHTQQKDLISFDLVG